MNKEIYYGKVWYWKYKILFIDFCIFNELVIELQEILFFNINI